MTYEQTVLIPESRELHLDLVLPKTMPIGTAYIRLVPQAPETMLLSEAALAKDWDTAEEDAAWQNL